MFNRPCAYDACHPVESVVSNAAYCVPCKCKRKRENAVRRSEKSITDIYDEELYQLEERRKEARNARAKNKSAWILENKSFAMFDLETTQLDADFGRILCGCIKPLDGEILTFAARTDDSKIVKKIRDELAKYDYIATWYGTGFDLPFLRTRLLVHNQEKLTPMRHTDMYYTARHNFKFASNRQSMVMLSLAGHAYRTPVIGRVWNDAGVGDKRALNTIVEHCQEDLKDLETLFKLLVPFRNLAETRLIG